MALYYGEKWRPHNDATAVEDMVRYEKLLRREFWRGQVHGGSEGPVHARHEATMFRDSSLAPPR